MSEENEVEQWIARWSEENQFLASGKPVNTNSKPVVGVRPDFSKIQQNLPYICSRSIIHEGKNPELDYVFQKSHDKVSNMSMQKWLKNNRENLPETVIDDLKKVCFKERETGTHTVSKRLKQILVPLEYTSPKEGYYSLTPLCVSGLAKMICDKAAERSKDREQSYGTVFIAPGQQIGGANPQNAGSLLFSFNAPLVAFNTPSVSETNRKMYRASYYGYRPYLTRDEKDGISDVIVSLDKTEKTNIPTWLSHYLEKLVKRIKIDLENRANNFYQELKKFDPDLEPAEIDLENDKGISKGLIYKDFQDHEWKERFSKWFISQIERDTKDSSLRYLPEPIKRVIIKTINN